MLKPHCYAWKTQCLSRVQGCSGKTGWEKQKLGHIEVLQGVVIDLMAGMGEGDVSAEGKGLSTKRGEQTNKPGGNALQTPWHPVPHSLLPFLEHGD